MQLIGEVVFHKKFGEGKILDKLDGMIIIHFPAGEKKFYFPDWKNQKNSFSGTIFHWMTKM